MIKVTTEIRVELMKEFPVSEKTVYNALNFLTGGYAAEQIRRRAVELGGKLMQEVTEAAEGPAKEEGGRSMFCAGCEMAAYPPCDKGQPCCKCSEVDCNSRQVCQKKGGEECMKKQGA